MRRFFRFVPLFVFVGVCCAIGRPSLAQDVPTSEVLQAKIDAAQGTTPASSFEAITYTQYGVVNRRTIVRSGADIRETSLTGRLQFSHGTYRNQTWSQNANGQTVVAQPDPPDTPQDQVTTTVSRVTKPFDAFVVARLDAAGHGTKDYVDPTSYRIVRRDELRPHDTSIITYDDFRTVDGYTLAWHWTVSAATPPTRSTTGSIPSSRGRSTTPKSRSRLHAAPSWSFPRIKPASRCRRR